MAAVSIRDRYHLRRDNFILDPEKSREDRGFYASRKDVDPLGIFRSLLKDLIQAKAPKKIFWGVYGGGKTHTIFTASAKLEELAGESGVSTWVVYVKTPVFEKSARFIDYYRAIVDRIRKQTIEELFLLAFNEASNDPSARDRSRLPEIIADKNPGMPDQLPLVIAGYQSYNAPVHIFWKYIRGESLSNSEKALTRLYSDLSTASPELLVEHLRAISRLMRRFKSAQLLLLLDEMERFEDLSREAVDSIETGLRELTDTTQNDIALILSASPTGGGNAIRDSTILTEPVVSRVGDSNIIQVPSMDDKDARRFVVSILHYVREPKADIPSLIAAAGSPEPVTPETYPFSERAIDSVVAKLIDNLTPRRILATLGESTAAAAMDDSKVVLSRHVDSA